MALNSSGQISLGGMPGTDAPAGQVPPGTSIAYELRGAPGATLPISFADADVRAMLGVTSPSQPILIPNDFWGKTAAPGVPPPGVTPPPTTPPTTPPPTTPPPTTPPPTTPPPTYVYYQYYLGFDQFSIEAACSTTQTLYYSICNPLVANTCYLLNSPDLLDPVGQGYYSNGTTYYDVNSSGLIDSIGSCPPPPTPPPTPPPPTPSPTSTCTTCTRSTFTNNTGDNLTIYYASCPDGLPASVYMEYNVTPPQTICYCDGTLDNPGGASETVIEVCSGGTPAPTTPPPTSPPTTPPPTTPPPTTPPPTTPPPTTPPPTLPPVDFTISSVCTSGTQSTVTVSTYTGGNGSPYYASVQLWDTPANAGSGALINVGTSARDYTNTNNGIWYVKVCSANQTNCTIKQITTACTPPPTTPPTTPPPTTPPPTYVYYPYILGFDQFSIETACSATQTTYYSICNPLVANTCYLLNTADLFDPVGQGYYSNGTVYYDVNSSGLIDSIGSCPPPPTPPPTPPPPTPSPTYACPNCTRSTFTNNTGDPLTIYYGACPSGEQTSVFMAYPSSPVTICYCDGTLDNPGGASETMIEVCSGGTPAPTTPPPTTPPPTTPPPTTPPPTTPPPTTPPPTTPPPTTPPPTTPPPTLSPVDFSISYTCTSGTQSTITIDNYTGGNGSPYFASTQVWDTPANAGSGAISSVGTAARNYTNVVNGTWYVKVCSQNQSSCTVKSITTACTPPPTTPPTTPPPTTPPPTPQPVTPQPTTPPPTTDGRYNCVDLGGGNYECQPVEGGTFDDISQCLANCPPI